MAEPLEDLLRSSARVTDDSLQTMQLADSMDALWVSAKAETSAPVIVPVRRSKVRRRVTAVVAALVVAGIGVGGAPAFADWVALHTGRYDTGSPADPEPKTPEREMWRMDSAEMVPHLRTWERQYPLAPGYSLAPLINDYSDAKNSQSTAGMVQDTVFFYSQCTWVHYWVTADRSGDTAAKKDATRGLVSTVAQVDSLHTLDEPGRALETDLGNAAKADEPALLKRELQINCDWNFR